METRLFKAYEKNKIREAETKRWQHMQSHLWRLRNDVSNGRREAASFDELDGDSRVPYSPNLTAFHYLPSPNPLPPNWNVDPDMPRRNDFVFELRHDAALAAIYHKDDYELPRRSGCPPPAFKARDYDIHDATVDDDQRREMHSFAGFDCLREEPLQVRRPNSTPIMMDGLTPTYQDRGVTSSLSPTPAEGEGEAAMAYVMSHPVLREMMEDMRRGSEALQKEAEERQGRRRL